jgi:vacuolar iron transporter family protein
MPLALHIEKHFLSSALVRDIVIGMADGLTVPFALAAGLSGAISSTEIIVTAGLAEIAAGAIAMGLGGYLAARQLEDCGCTVIGPEGRLRPALKAARHEVLDGAILDVNLGGEFCFPIAGALTARKVRYVFVSGYDSISVWPPEYAGVPRVTKPYRFPELAELLVQHIAQHRYN